MIESNFFKTKLSMNNITEYWIGYLMAFVGWLVAFLFPIAGFLAFTTFLVLADLITGTRAAVKRQEKLTSRGFRRTVEKLTLYFIAILAAHGMSIVFFDGHQFAPLAYLTAFAIALTEFQSNVENIETVTGVHIWREVKERLRINSKNKKDEK